MKFFMMKKINLTFEHSLTLRRRSICSLEWNTLENHTKLLQHLTVSQLKTNKVLLL